MNLRQTQTCTLNYKIVFDDRDVGRSRARQKGPRLIAVTFDSEKEGCICWNVEDELRRSKSDEGTIKGCLFGNNIGTSYTTAGHSPPLIYDTLSCIKN